MNVRKAIGTLGVIIIIAMILFGIYLIMNIEAIREWIEKSGEMQQILSPEKEVMVPLPVKVKVVDYFTSDPKSGVTVKLFYRDEKDSGTTDTSGIWVSSIKVMPKEPVTILVIGEGYRTWLTTIIKPYTREQLDVLGPGVTYEVKVKVKEVGTFDIGALDPDYNSIAEYGDYNITKTGITQPLITAVLKNTMDNSGLPVFGKGKDPETERSYTNIFIVEIKGSGVIVTNTEAELIYSDVSKKIYVFKLPEDALDRVVKTTGEIVKQGLYSIGVQFDASALEAGSSVEVTFMIVTMADIDYMKLHGGTLNPEAVVQKTFTFTISS